MKLLMLLRLEIAFKILKSFSLRNYIIDIASFWLQYQNDNIDRIVEYRMSTLITIPNQIPDCHIFAAV